jgi:hypothetical protein
LSRYSTTLWSNSFLPRKTPAFPEHARVCAAVTTKGTHLTRNFICSNFIGGSAMNHRIMRRQWLSWSGFLLSTFFVLALTLGYVR